MAQLPFIAAIDAGIHQEMRRDPNVLYFGQNMATTENHEFVAAYGHDRVRVTPISETAEIGMAIGPRRQSRSSACRRSAMMARVGFAPSMKNS